MKRMILKEFIEDHVQKDCEYFVVYALEEGSMYTTMRVDEKQMKAMKDQYEETGTITLYAPLVREETIHPSMLAIGKIQHELRPYLREVPEEEVVVHEVKPVDHIDIKLTLVD